jgi:hypothetical protein
LKYAAILVDQSESLPMMTAIAPSLNPSLLGQDYRTDIKDVCSRWISGELLTQSKYLTNY